MKITFVPQKSAREERTRRHGGNQGERSIETHGIGGIHTGERIAMPNTNSAEHIGQGGLAQLAKAIGLGLKMAKILKLKN